MFLLLKPKFQVPKRQLNYVQFRSDRTNIIDLHGKKSKTNNSSGKSNLQKRRLKENLQRNMLQERDTFPCSTMACSDEITIP